MTFPFASTFQAGGAGVNGLVVGAYDASRFGGAPAFDAAPPGGSPDAMATTDNTFGQPGAFVVDLPTTDEYYLTAVYLGHRYWQGPVAGAGAGGAGGGAFPAPVVVMSNDPAEVTSTPPSGAATVDGTPVLDGWRVGLAAQTVGVDNGLWIANTTGLWTRPADWATGSVQKDGTLVAVGEQVGDFNWASIWQLGADVTVDTGSAFLQLLVSYPALNVTPQVGSLPIMQLNTQLTASGNLLDVLAELIVGGQLKLGGSVFTAPGTLLTGNGPLNTLSPGAVAPMGLPAASVGVATIIAKNQSGAAIVITPNGGDTIDGVGGGTSLADGASWWLQSDGTSNWAILASH